MHVSCCLERLYKAVLIMENPPENHDILPSSQLIKQGAEAKVYRGVFLGRSCIVKQRFKKKYRHPKLDAKLTHKRTVQEVRSILRCRKQGDDDSSLFRLILELGLYHVESLHTVYSIQGNFRPIVFGGMLWEMSIVGNMRALTANQNIHVFRIRVRPNL